MFAGYLYPTSTVSRCPRFHQCKISQKCQNFDKHNLECSVCEQRTNTHEIDPNSVPLGGILPEGEYIPDLQDAIVTLEKRIRKSYVTYDGERSHNNAEIVDKALKERKASDMLARYMGKTEHQMEEEIYRTLLSGDEAETIGRLL